MQAAISRVILDQMSSIAEGASIFHRTEEEVHPLCLAAATPAMLNKGGMFNMFDDYFKVQSGLPDAGTAS